jgi:hypothetical protein
MTSHRTINGAPASGTVGVRLIGQATDLAAVLADLTAAGVEIVSMPSRPFRNRRTSAIRVYLIARPATPQTTHEATPDTDRRNA